MLAPAKNHPTIAKTGALERLCRRRAVALGDSAPGGGSGSSSVGVVGVDVGVGLGVVLSVLEGVVVVDIVLDICEINAGVVHGHLPCQIDQGRAGLGWRGTGRGVDE